VYGAINLVIDYNWFCSFFEYFYYNTRTSSDSDMLKTYVSRYSSYKDFEQDFIKQNSEISLYPNPVINNKLNVDILLFEDESMLYSINDISGRNIVSNIPASIINGRQVFDFNNLENGMYLLTFTSQYRTITRKIQIAR